MGGLPNEAPTIQEAACWAHVRRKFVDLAVSNPAPIAEEALRRIGEFYNTENIIRGSSLSSDKLFAVNRRSQGMKLSGTGWTII